jgi:hypothetical protein
MQRTAITWLWPGLSGALGALGCTNSPVYLPGPDAIVATDNGMGMLEGRASLTLPIQLETREDAADRATLQATLDPVRVPYVRVGDLEVSVEWTIHNATATACEAKIQLNGANEYWTYDPSLIEIDPTDPDAPDAPGLAGDIPLHVAASGSLSGLFTEDQLREASIDLDQITRANWHPFRAVLTISKNADSFSELTAPMPGVDDYMQTPTGLEIPRAAFAQILRVDLVFKPDCDMTLEYNVRVRDIRDILGDELLDTPVSELQYDPATFMPPAYTL